MKRFVLVVTLATAVLDSYAIIVLDNTEQKQGVTRRRPPLLIRDNMQQEQSAAESTRSDVRVQGFRSSVIHKPASIDGPGGLTVQDPPKGWPFSEIHVNFNSHMTENEGSGLPSIITPSPDEVRIKQNQQQQIQHERKNKHFIHQHKSQHRQELRYERGNLIHPQHQVQQQYLQQKPSQAVATATNSSGHLNNGFVQSVDARKFKQPLTYIITAIGNQQTGIVPGNENREIVTEPSENIPVTKAANSHLLTGYNFELITPPGAPANSDKMSDVIKQEVSASGTRLSDDVNSLNRNKQQQNNSLYVHTEPTSTQNQASSRVNVQHNDVGIVTNYVWRDLSPGLEISSNAPQLTVGSQQIPTVAKETRTTDFKKDEQETSMSGKGVTRNVGVQSRTNVQSVHVPKFDHANALGHSANFGHRDAVASLPPHFHTGGEHANQDHSVTPSQDQATGQQEQNIKYKSTDHESIQNSLPDAGKSNKHMNTVLVGTSDSPGKAQALYNNGGHFNQQPTQQQTQVYSLLPQSSYSVVPTDHKVLTINTGLIQGVPGALILSNGLHAGHQNILLAGQGMTNLGGHGAPLHAFYFPVSGFHSTPLGNYQAQKGTVVGQHMGHVQQSPSVLVNSNVGDGIFSLTPMPYLGLINGGLYGNTGIGGLHLLQGNMLGIEGLQGGTSLHSGQSGGIQFGGNHFLSSGKELASDDHSTLAREYYEPGLQLELQAAGLQEHSTLQVQGNRHVPMAAGKNLPSSQSASLYQHQQVNKQHSMTPQINVHPNGFGVNILQQNPLLQRGFKTGGYHGLPAGRHRFPQQPSVFPAYDHAAGVPYRGYQTFSVTPQIHEPLFKTSSHPSGFKLNTFPTQSPYRIEQEMPQPQTAVKRDGNVSKPISVPELGTGLGSKTAQGWSKHYVSSNSGKRSIPASNYFFTTN